MRSRQDIEAEIATTEARLQQLKQELIQIDSTPTLSSAAQISNGDSASSGPWPLATEDYQRYGRQMIMPEVGLQGQLNIRKSSVLIVGVGGLGCPAAAYLAGAGISRLGLVDGDTVEVSNLHRQILHTTERVGMHKVDSAVASLRQLNPTIQYEPYRSHLTPQAALELFSRYDLILDCTDHPTSRYLVSDAAVLAGKPLVSASALKTEGQLHVLNYPPTPPSQPSNELQHGQDQAQKATLEGGPCYRCIYPKPPPPETITSCGEGGILGPVVGTMGVLMALEALKIITAKKLPDPGLPHTFNMFSTYPTLQFRSLRMKGKRAECVACGSTRTITAESLNSGSLDYIAFCGVTNPVRILDEAERISALDLRQQTSLSLDSSSFSSFNIPAPGHQKVTIIDVRERTPFELASLPGSINIPFSRFESGQIESAHTLKRHDDGIERPGTLRIPYDGSPLVFVCRLGNDSQVAARKMKMWGYADGGRWIGDLKGGLRAWRAEVEPGWPDF